MFRYRLCVLLFILAQLPALFVAGPGMANTGHFSWFIYGWMGLGLPGIASVLILAVAWVLNPNPAPPMYQPPPPPFRRY